MGSMKKKKKEKVVDRKQLRSPVLERQASAAIPSSCGAENQPWGFECVGQLCQLSFSPALELIVLLLLLLS